MTFKNLSVFLSGALAAFAIAFLTSPGTVGSQPAPAKPPASRNGEMAPGASGTLPPAPEAPPVPASLGRRTTVVAATEKAAPAVVSISVRRRAVVAVNPFCQAPVFDVFGPR